MRQLTTRTIVPGPIRPVRGVCFFKRVNVFRRVDFFDRIDFFEGIDVLLG
jgi:hypothetical protein